MLTSGFGTLMFTAVKSRKENPRKISYFIFFNALSMAGGRRGPGRQPANRPVPLASAHNVRNSSQSATLRQRNGPNVVGNNPLMTTTLITITPIRHLDIPSLPTDGNLFFEAMMLVYLLMALFLQYVNIYKTIWWLPVPPSNTALNFYLINPFLVIFITVVLSRRLIWSLVSFQGNVLTISFCVIQLFKFVLVVGFVFLAGYSLWKLFGNNSPLNILFLAYPLVSYFLLYGLTFDTSTPIFLLQSSVKSMDDDYSKVGSHDLSRIIPLHKCTHSPSDTRREADLLKVDFNMRIKNVLFNSMVCAYYVGFVPICFLQSSMYLDLWWSCQHIAFVWINSFIMFSSHFLPHKYCDVLHRCALHLGCWQKIDHGYSNTPQHVWSDLTVWPQGVLVRYQKALYKAVGQQNVAQPSDSSYARFYFMFSQPLRVLNIMVVLQIFVVVYQLYLLARYSHWNYVISISLLLFSNYYVLFKLLRDRFVLGKAYALENPD
ncbi:transmembrane protein 39A-like isoform X2 [Anneissia japonica]|uniref:transmembrane protein 39A-like isoform X2 n=1 Tax=Anneissia japonica TaxID=1529436 RepID=UPI0014257E93|nr:transmembrane protein 39A-like isoform X2 [Anneissia japonica]